jgi:hypothetical protein
MKSLVKESILSLSAKVMWYVLAKFECNIGRLNVLLTQWLKQILESRIPEEQEDVSNLTSINDIRNGMLVSSALHSSVDKKKLVILKVFLLSRDSVISSYSQSDPEPRPQL